VPHPTQRPVIYRSASGDIHAAARHRFGAAAGSQAQAVGGGRLRRVFEAVVTCGETGGDQAAGRACQGGAASAHHTCSADTAVGDSVQCGTAGLPEQLVYPVLSRPWGMIRPWGLGRQGCHGSARPRCPPPHAAPRAPAPAPAMRPTAQHSTAQHSSSSRAGQQMQPAVHHTRHTLPGCLSVASQRERERWGGGRGRGAASYGRPQQGM
jgi:hypothetical protein